MSKNIVCVSYQNEILDSTIVLFTNVLLEFKVNRKDR